MENIHWREDIENAPSNTCLECQWYEGSVLCTGKLMNYQPTDLSGRKWSEVERGWQETPPKRQDNGKIVKIEPICWRELPDGQSKRRPW